ncbi:Acyl-coenzyme A thioesterase 13-like Protein [Tribolium castaneum]|uniref:Acyl-coenzyme A thioesterase 13-like Protein n=1 Tax=Tribolium castaneum TaxID=7070 RepID=D2CG36_TRICA|nr:PREDICTED: acyl-coenzyme A thioesterase 13 [Tribolium castaneum]EFA12682.1 Acyl-coenzyme A thioesterase 13-like Protein [Tribolium castaneum]|eukprot:XP_008197952.1 PREDICTED: acyl-coenzyme A thioesterase 13 [Tribolium castaneum]
MTQAPFLKDVAALVKFLQFRAASFDRVLQKLNVISLGNGKCSVEMKVDDDHVDQTGKLHIGLSSTLVDCISGFALMSQLPNMHVTTDISLRNFNGPKTGNEIVIDGHVNKVVDNLAFLEVKIKDKATGELLLQGTHTKYVLVN